MKKLTLLGLVALSSLSFARDYEYNEKRDIVIPMEESVERISRFTPGEWSSLESQTQENFVKYQGFHEELNKDLDEMGNNTMR